VAEVHARLKKRTHRVVRKRHMSSPVGSSADP
jgi:hypothetical protein